MLSDLFFGMYLSHVQVRKREIKLQIRVNQMAGRITTVKKHGAVLLFRVTKGLT